MAKYKLIKTYPGSPELGTIASRGMGIKFEHPNGIVNGFVSSKGKDFESLIENQPEFWEEIVEKEYEILSYTFKESGLTVTKNFNSHVGLFGREGFYISESRIKNASIHSVKRLSDGEVFTVGDKIRLNQIGSPVRTIKSINRTFVDNIIFEHYIGTIFLKDAVKIKQPLFTTEDGVDIYEGDEYFEVITPDFHNKPCVWNIIPNETRGNIIYDQVGNKRNGRLWFSNKESAEEYILYNKPCLSINDLINKSTHRVLIEELKNIVRSKLHESKN